MLYYLYIWIFLFQQWRDTIAMSQIFEDALVKGYSIAEIIEKKEYLSETCNDLVACINEPDSTGYSLLHICVSEWDSTTEEIDISNMEALIEAGAEVDKVDNEHGTALFQAVLGVGITRVPMTPIEILVKHGANPNAKCKHWHVEGKEESPMTRSVEKVVEWAKNVPPGAEDSDFGWKPVFWKTLENCFHLLVENGGNINEDAPRMQHGTLLDYMIETAILPHPWKFAMPSLHNMIETMIKKGAIVYNTENLKKYKQLNHQPAVELEKLFQKSQ